jgi:recombination protein RecA
MPKKKSNQEQDPEQKKDSQAEGPSAEEIQAKKEADQKKLQEQAIKAREKMLEALRKKLNVKDAGQIQFADTYEAIPDVISTGHANLDEAICPSFYAKNGRGGVPLGYLCEFYGPNAGGKSCLGMKMAANVHKTEGSLVLWQDAEGSFQPEWAMSHGVDPSRVVLNNQPKFITAEQFLTELEKNVKTGMYRLAVVDSLAGLTPQKILECELDDNEKIGEKARLMSRSLPRIVAAAKEGCCTVVFINQIRMKIGVMYADPETTPGGESLKFYASLRLRLSQASSKTRGILNADGEEIGIRSKVVIKKSRFGPPFKETVIPIYYGEERPHPFDILVDLALSNKIIVTKKKKDDVMFLFPPHINEPVEDMEKLKEKLTPKMIADMAEMVKTKALVDPDVIDFVKERQIGLADLLGETKENA